MSAPLARRDVAIVAAVKLGVSMLVLACGFRAISDDDFARVVISQSFAHAPRLDPSGTSWLPLPFWLQGGIMSIAGRSLGVARATALMLGVVSAVLVYVAARWLHVSSAGALVGSLLGCAIPHAAWLGVATVPDGPVAALILLGAASVGSDRISRRLAGGLALLAAGLSRYEAWPVAIVFVALTVADAVKHRSGKWAAVAAVAALGPIGWMLHGAANHADPLFFVARVVAYHRAVAEVPSSVLTRLADHPVGLFRSEPELLVLTVTVLAMTWLRQRCTCALHRYFWPALLMAALLGFLVVGDLLGSAPTHHSERPLLAIWLGCALLTGDLSVQRWRAAGARQRALGVASLVLLTAAAASLIRPRIVRHDGFIDRSQEVAIGRAAGVALGEGGGRLLVDTDDFGFYAVIAGFAQPERAGPFDTRDPRRSAAADAFADPRTLAERLRQEPAKWFVAAARHAEIARSVGTPRAANARFMLVEVE